MRKCIRCGSEMKEDCAVKVEGAGYGSSSLLMKPNCLAAGSGNPKLPSAPNAEKFLSIWRMSANWDRQVKMYPCIGGVVMAEPIVKTTALEKYYKTGTQLVKALDGVDFEVKEREFVAIIGNPEAENHPAPYAGRTGHPHKRKRHCGRRRSGTLDNDRLAVFRRRKVGFIFQQYNLIPDLNVYDNILFPLELDGARINRKFIDYLLETLTFPPKRKCSRPCSPAVNSSGLPLSGP